MKARHMVIYLVLVLMVCGISQAATKVLEWKFENNLNDTSGSGIDGLAFGTVAYSSGVVGQALDCDSTNCAYKTGIDTSILPVLAADTWTVNVWVYPTVTPGSWQLAWCLGQKPYGSADTNSRTTYSSASAKIVFTDGKGSNWLSTGIGWDVGQWQMVTTTYDGTKVRVYKNGVLIGVKPFTFENAPGEVRIPSYAWSASNFFVGKFDEFTVWRGSLSQQEIIDLIPAGVLPDISLKELVVYYTMDDPSESEMTMPDHSGKGNDGLLYGYTSPLSEWLVNGYRDSALKFAGEQSVDLPGPAKISNNVQYSAAFWLKSGNQSYESAFYSEKGESGNGSSFIIRANNENLQVYSKDQWYDMVYGIEFDASEYLNGASWNHIAVVADGDAGTAKVYVNGDLVADANYLKSDSKVLAEASVGYNWDSDKFIETAYIDEVRLYRGLLTEGEIKAMACLGNLDNDSDVDFEDLKIFTEDWIEDTQVSANQTYVLDDMEGDLGKWSVHASDDYSGTGTISTTANAFAGSGGLQWDYDLPSTSGTNNYTTIVYDCGQTMDFSDYDQMNLYMYRHSGNTAENLIYLKFTNASNDVKAEAWVSGNNCVVEPADQWALWNIDLDSLLGEGGSGSKDSSDLNDIRYILIGCGSWDRSDGRTGTIDIDEVKMIKQSVCSSKLDGDLNFDCKVNFDDFVILAQDWMLGVE